LYVETNYIVGQAFSQDPVAATILAEAQKVGAEVCVPSICAQEALATVEMRVKRTNNFSRTIQVKLRELRADHSPTAQAILTLLNQTLIENGRLANERQLRLTAVFQSLSNARFVHVDNQTTSQAVFAPIIVGAATDNLILHAIVADAVAAPASDMGFFTRNTRDFNDPAVIASLTNAGINSMFSPVGTSIAARPPVRSERARWNCPGLMDKWFRQLSELRTRLDCGTRGLSEVV